MASDVARAAGIAESQVVRFDTNTSAWPPVAWEQTVLDVPRLPANEYPHPSNEPLRSTLASALDVQPEHVVVTCGADEALYLVASVYLGPGAKAVVADPSFSMFRVVSESVGAEMLRVPLDNDWQLPRKALLQAVTEPSVKVAWLCSPNNPTGRLLPRELIEDVLKQAPDVLVCIDEAYYEISAITCVDLVTRYANVAIVRTFSKGYGLAGARVGYLVAQPEITRTIESVRLPQNMTAFGIAAACRAFADQDGLAERVQAINQERERLRQELQKRGWQVLPSAANFVLAKPPREAVAVAQWLQRGGLIARSYGSNPRLKEWLRLSVRSPEEDDRLLSRLDAQ
ncbi:MAG TPA: histidinol-phosphate transaminase [Chloroflexota bacterium]|nr:histidinol-phosphate transaminase [Chloroflexota bacterium]